MKQSVGSTWGKPFQRRAWRRTTLLLALLFLLAGLAQMALMSPLSSGRAVAQGASCQGRILILLQGLATDSSTGQPYFADILSALNGQITYNNFVYFSYNPNNPSSYTVQDSLQSTATSVDALHRTISSQISQCAGVRIDLIGHSMGGYVALRYLAQYGTNAEGTHVQHLITLDSPLNGISPDETQNFASLLMSVGTDPSMSILAFPAVQDLVNAYTNPNTSQQNINLARSLSSHVVIGTFGSHDDLVVPYDNAIIRGYQYEFSLGLVSDLCPEYVDACVGHNQILHDPGVLAQIVNLLGSNGGSGCSQWNISGTWQLVASNNYRPVLSLQQNGTAISGTITLSADDQAKGNYVMNSGTLTGTLVGNQLQFTTSQMAKRDGSASQGQYTGTVVQGQITNGQAQDLLHPGSTATWSASGPGVCAGASASVGNTGSSPNAPAS